MRRGGSQRISSTGVFRWCLTRLDGAGPDTPWYCGLGPHEPPTPLDGRKHTKDEQENPHGNLQSRSGLSRQNVLKLQIAIQVVYSRLRDDPRGRQVAGVRPLLWPAAVVPICVYETSAVQTFYRLARFPK
jgi:hypothetical protein